MRFMGWTGVVEVKPLSRQAAVDLGAEMIGEVVIFCVAVGTLYAEVKRGQGKERKKEEEQNAKLFSLQQQITELSVITGKQNAEIKDLTNMLQNIELSIVNKGVSIS